MQRSSVRRLALAAAPVALVVSACSAGVSDAESDACHHLHVWFTGDHDPAELDERVVTAQGYVRDVEDSPVVDALSVVAGAPEDERAAAVDAFLEVCTDNGWEPVEG